MGVVAAVRPLKLFSLVFLLSSLSLTQTSSRVLSLNQWMKAN